MHCNITLLCLGYDWIVLEIITTTPTNFQTVKRRTGASWVRAIDAGTGGEATRFHVRIQDPGSPAALRALIRSVPARLSEKHVIAVEMFLDAYCEGGSVDDLATVVEGFYRFTTKPASANRRFVFARKKGCTEGLGLPKSNREKLRQGWTLCVGNQGNVEDDEPEDRARGKFRADARSQRFYVKTTDENETRLPVDQHRARMEWTLRREGLPFTTLDEAEALSARTLASYYKFRRFKSDASSIGRIAAECLDQVGEQRCRRRRDRSKREFAPWTEADIALNRRVYDAARCLQARVRAGGGGRKFRSTNAPKSLPKLKACSSI